MGLHGVVTSLARKKSAGFNSQMLHQDILTFYERKILFIFKYKYYGNIH